MAKKKTKKKPAPKVKPKPKARPKKAASRGTAAASGRKKAAPGKKPAPKAHAKSKRSSVAPSRMAAAAELIEIEQKLLAGETSPALTDRWVKLLSDVLGAAPGARGRRSVRLPAGLPVRLGIRKGEFVCQLTDLSQLGITISGQVLAYVTVGEAIELRAIERAGTSHDIGVRCDVVHIDGRRTPPTAGLELASDNDDAARQRYFNTIYYPLYLQYLERTASAQA